MISVFIRILIYTVYIRIDWHMWQDLWVYLVAWVIFPLGAPAQMALDILHQHNTSWSRAGRCLTNVANKIAPSLPRMWPAVLVRATNRVANTCVRDILPGVGKDWAWRFMYVYIICMSHIIIGRSAVHKEPEASCHQWACQVWYWVAWFAKAPRRGRFSKGRAYLDLLKNVVCYASEQKNCTWHSNSSLEKRLASLNHPKVFQRFNIWQHEHGSASTPACGLPGLPGSFSWIQYDTPIVDLMGPPRNGFDSISTPAMPRRLCSLCKARSLCLTTGEGGGQFNSRFRQE